MKSILILALSFLIAIKIVMSPNPIIDVSQFWYSACNDSQNIHYDKNLVIDTEIKNQDGTISPYVIQGKYEESLMTYDAFPQCVKFNDTLKKYYEYVNVSCIKEKCSTIVNYNVITGEQKVVWTSGK